MRSDRSDHAGRSAQAAFVDAAAAARRRRLLRVLVVGVVVVLAVVALLAPSDRVAAAVGVAVAIGVALRWRPRADPDRWRRGAAGEVATAALLEGLSSRRWAVLHDRAVPGSRANVDHLVIGPTGVWVVDTKTVAGAPGGGWMARRAAGRRVDTAAAAWEASVVEDRIGVEARPVVAVHGVRLPRRVGGVTVVPADRLVRRLRRRRGSARLGPAEVAAVATECDRLFRPASARAARSHTAVRGAR